MALDSSYGMCCTEPAYGAIRHGLICSCTRVVAFADATPDPARLRLARSPPLPAYAISYAISYAVSVICLCPLQYQPMPSPMQSPVYISAIFASCLCTCYETAGICLRSCYAISGTERARDGTSAHMAACTAEVAALQTVGGSGGEEAREPSTVVLCYAVCVCRAVVEEYGAM
eukprot:3941250-Rhodomonas_salina.1